MPPRQPIEPMQSPPSKGKKTLASIGFGLVATALVYVGIPREESGRTVTTNVVDGTVVATNVRGDRHLAAYWDATGRVWTICDGDTLNVQPHEVDTPAQCDARLERQLVAHAEPIMRCVPALRRPERQHQLAGSLLITYNVGVGAFCNSSIARHFNAGRWRAGCDAFLLYNRSGGHVLAGLDARRHRERALCLEDL